MSKFAVFQDADRVVVDVGPRCRDVLITCGSAETLVQALRAAANGAEKELPTLVRGDVWNVRVESYDGLVALRLRGPEPGCVGRVLLLASQARQLADVVQFKAQQAAYRMRFVFAG